MFVSNERAETMLKYSVLRKSNYFRGIKSPWLLDGGTGDLQDQHFSQKNN